VLKSEKTTINGTGYKVTQLPYKLGHKLLLRLYKVAGPALADTFAHAPEGSLAEVQVRDVAPALAAALKGLAEQLHEADFDFAVETLAEYTQISSEPDKWIPLKSQMEFHFAGNYAELFQWLGFALKVNYGGFIGERGALAALLARVKKASQSPNTSIGDSTGSPLANDIPAP
jgi:hypothetical protein